MIRWPGSLFGRLRVSDPERWRAGDQAECISHGRWFEGGMMPVAGPRRGEVRTVIAVRRGRDPITGEPVLFLGFDRWPKPYIARAFRKVRPRADEATAAEAAFTRLLRAPARRLEDV